MKTTHDNNKFLFAIEENLCYSFFMLPTADIYFKRLRNNPKVRKGFISAPLNINPKTIKNTVLP